MVGLCHVCANTGDKPFRMPLYAEYGCCGMDKCFDGAIRCACGDRKPLCNTVDGLVMKAVDRLRRAKHGLEQAEASHTVAAVHVALCVLVQRTAQKDIDRLHPTAYAEYRLAARKECVKKCLFFRVKITLVQGGCP